MTLLGRKSVAVNVSDIAAMGGEPHYLTLGLGVPADMAVQQLEDFVAGFLAAADLYGATLVGGDTCRSPGPLFISVTAEGSVPAGEIVRRSGARCGDAVYVSGTLGDSALALRRLMAGEPVDPFLARRHHDPRARTELGRGLAAAGLPTAMIDVSDGLLADLGHLLSASNVGARLNWETIPHSEAFRRAAAPGPELLLLSLRGGEDYELAFTVPSGKEAALAAVAEAVDCRVTRIGTIVPPEHGLTVCDRHGRDYASGMKGFDHFSGG
jgi:thiamine-monophosphate kinase